MHETVTRLYTLWNKEYNPTIPVECFWLIIRTHPGVLAFITHILCINRIDMALALWIWYIIYDIFFNFIIFIIVLLNFGETWRLKGHAWLHCGGRCCCYVAVIVRTRTAFKKPLSLNAYWDFKQCMNALWMFISNTESPWGPRVIDNDDQHHFKQWGICDNYLLSQPQPLKMTCYIYKTLYHVPEHRGEIVLWSDTAYIKLRWPIFARLILSCIID